MPVLNLSFFWFSHTYFFLFYYSVFKCKPKFYLPVVVCKEIDLI